MKTPRYYQREAVDSLYSYFQTSCGHPCLALPTGTGKSFIIALAIAEFLHYWPEMRVLMVTHVKELISQNLAELLELWPDAPVSVYSAGLKQKEISQITFAGIASIYEKASELGTINIVFVDEAHLISNKENSMYSKFITSLMALNPHLRVVGLTATPYRLGQGLVTDSGLFTDICYDITKFENFNRLIKEGFLCKLITKATHTVYNTEGISIQNGDYNQKELQLRVDEDDVNFKICQEIVEYGHDRKCWMVFTTGVKHTEKITSYLQALGIEACAVHSKMGDKQRDKNIELFDEGYYRAIVHNGLLATGYNNKNIDFIPHLRPSVSPGFWVQGLGRGFRVSPQKYNCLVLDFAGNTARLGPVNDPVKPRKKGNKKGEVPIKICPDCGVYNHSASPICDNCGFIFPTHCKLQTTASDLPIIRETKEEVCIETFNVTHVIYSASKKTGRKPILKVTYYSGLTRFYESVCLEHEGYARRLAENWWKLRFPEHGIIPNTVEEALQYAASLKKPVGITVNTAKKFPEVISVSF